MGKIFNARIRFLPTSEGGRSTPAMSGIRPLLKLNEILTSCVIRSAEPSEIFASGIDCDVTIEILFWDEYGGRFVRDAPIELYDGNRLIARGMWRY